MGVFTMIGKVQVGDKFKIKNNTIANASEPESGSDKQYDDNF